MNTAESVLRQIWRLLSRVGSALSSLYKDDVKVLKFKNIELLHETNNFSIKNGQLIFSDNPTKNRWELAAELSVARRDFLAALTKNETITERDQALLLMINSALRRFGPEGYEPEDSFPIQCDKEGNELNLEQIKTRQLDYLAKKKTSVLKDLYSRTINQGDRKLLLIIDDTIERLNPAAFKFDTKSDEFKQQMSEYTTNITEALAKERDDLSVSLKNNKLTGDELKEGHAVIETFNKKIHDFKSGDAELPIVNPPEFESLVDIHQKQRLDALVKIKNEFLTVIDKNNPPREYLDLILTIEEVSKDLQENSFAKQLESAYAVQKTDD